MKCSVIVMLCGSNVNIPPWQLHVQWYLSCRDTCGAEQVSLHRRCPLIRGTRITDKCFEHIYNLYSQPPHQYPQHIYIHITEQLRKVSQLCPWQAMPQCLHISLSSKKVCDRLLLCECSLVNAVFLNYTLHCRDGVQHGCVSSTRGIVYKFSNTPEGLLVCQHGWKLSMFLLLLLLAAGTSGWHIPSCLRNEGRFPVIVDHIGGSGGIVHWHKVRPGYCT